MSLLYDTKNGQNIRLNAKAWLLLVKFNLIELHCSQPEQNWSESLLSASSWGLFCPFLWVWYLCIVWWSFILLWLFEVFYWAKPKWEESERVSLIKALVLCTQRLYQDIFSSLLWPSGITSVQCWLHYSVSTVMKVSCIFISACVANRNEYFDCGVKKKWSALLNGMCHNQMQKLWFIHYFQSFYCVES